MSTRENIRLIARTPFFDSVLFVAMATRHMILQSVLFLNHAIQGLNYTYDVMN